MDSILGNKKAADATLREHFAAMAMEALVSARMTHNGVYNPDKLSSDAVIYADALLKALEK